ncbi:hypothetical protein [Aliagarivorans taiwanensis]|nr:hypothetical protein [Aliagarivorans taiwanensis]
MTNPTALERHYGHAITADPHSLCRTRPSMVTRESGDCHEKAFRKNRR